MKKIILMMISILSVSCSNSFKKNESSKGTKVDVTSLTENEHLSFSMGHLFSSNIQNQDLSPDMKWFIKGIENQLSGLEAPMTLEEYTAKIDSIQKKLFEEESSKNLQKAEEFLAKNKEDPSVISINEFVQFSILQEGSGTEEITEQSSALVFYKGMLIDGSVFNEVTKEMSPTIIPMEEIISGLAQGMKGMKEGEIRKIFLHPSVAYETKGHLPPNSLLIFEIEVVKTNVDSQENEQNEEADISKTQIESAIAS